MKKYILIFSLITFCTGISLNDENSVAEEPEIPSTFQPATTVYRFTIYSEYGYYLREEDWGSYCIYVTGYDFREYRCEREFEDAIEFLTNLEFNSALDEYREGWRTQLLTYKPLTKAEYEQSMELKPYESTDWEMNLTIEEINYLCKYISTGMVMNRFANENHPLEVYEKNPLFLDYSYEVKVDYGCFDINTNDKIYLSGPLFYQDNQWWGFIKYDEDYWRNYKKDIEVFAFMTKFVKRVSLGENILDE